MLYISHLLKSSLLMGLAVFMLAGCTITTTLIEPDPVEITEPETEPKRNETPESASAPHHVATDKLITPRKQSGASSFRPPQQAKSRAEQPAVQSVIQNKQPENPEQALTAEPENSPTATAEKNPLAEQYQVDAPEFDPALGEESSESSASSKKPETAERPETSASSESRPSSSEYEYAQDASAASQAQPDGKEEATQEAGTSGSQELSDEALAKEQIAGGGAPSSETPAPAETTQEQTADNAQFVTETSAASEPSKPEASAGEEEKLAGAAGGVNVPSEAPAVSDKTDHSDHDHRYIADQHVEGAEDEPPKKTKSLHWNMQRQVRPSAPN